MTIEQRVADLEAKMLQLSAFLDTAGTYQSRYSGEELDEYLDRISGGFDTSDLANRQLSNLDTPQLALANLGAGVQPNKIINGDFKINQRNWSRADSAVNQKIHDMWYLSWTPGASGSAEALQDGGVKINSTTVSGFDPGGVITNKFEGAINGTWTLSVYMRVDNLPAGSNIAIQVANDTKQSYPGYSITSETAKIGEYSIYTLTTDISGWEDSDIMHVSVYNYGGPAMFSVKAVKLEPGKNQTRAYLKSDGTWELLQQPENSYADQLLKCQRYLVMFGSKTGHAPLGIGQARSTTDIVMVLPTVCTMRTSPVVKLTGGIIARNASSYFTLANPSVEAYGPSSALVACPGADLTQGLAYDMFLSPNNFLELSAEL